MRITRWLVALATAYALGMAALVAFATGAGAAHPTWLCIDLEPDSAYAHTNDGITDRLTATLGASDSGHPPEKEGCVTEEGSSSGTEVEIDFEFSGDLDTDSSNSPESPDQTCRIAAEENSCSIAPPSYGSGGRQTIAGWIDGDQDNDTVEADLEEGQDESQDPGSAEPDSTDVALWNWTHYDTCSSCVATAVNIRYLSRSRTFEGSVSHGDPYCDQHRLVRLRRVRDGRDPVVGHDETDVNRVWRIGGLKRKSGRFYAVAPRKETSRITCGRGRSPTIRVR